MKTPAALLAAFLTLAACADNSKPSAAAGKAYFTQVGCASCHRIGSEGSATGPDLTLAGFRHSKEWLELFLKDPKAWKPDTLMPDTRMSPAARASIVEFLAERDGRDWTTKPWAGATGLEKGRLIYLRAGCVACHGGGGLGGYPNNNVKGGKIPALANASETYSKAELVAKIKNGVRHPEKGDPKGPEPLVWMPAWSEKLSDDELAAVADYVLSFKPAAGAPKSDW